MNMILSNLLTSYRMVSHLSSVYLLSFCLTGLYDGSMPNLCSIISLGIMCIFDICHAKISRFFWRKVMSVSSYLESRHVLTWNFFFGSLRLAGTSLSATSFFKPADWSVGCWFDAEAPYAPFLADDGRGESIVNGLAAADLNDELLSCVFAILAACSWVAFLPNHPTCIKEAESPLMSPIGGWTCNSKI
jgi:hypothetical protein